MAFDAEKSVFGTDAELILDGDECGEATEFQAKVTATKQDVPMCGVKSKQNRIVGYEGKGSLKLTKISDRMAKLISDNLKKCKSTKVSIISIVGDEENGYSRVQIKDASFDDLTLADWASQKIIEETYPFTFGDWEFLDYRS